MFGERLRAWVRIKLARYRCRRRRRRRSRKETRDSVPPGLPSANIPPPKLLSQATSPFFSRLPPEIRRQIYITAFGDRIIHIDLRFAGPDPRTADTDSLSLKGHTGINPLGRSPGPIDKNAEWRWWSSVCHRNPAYGVWRDDCRSGFSNCSMWTGLKVGPSSACWVGVVGWLGACKQAYHEALPILVSTNTFHIASPILLHHFSLLLPPSLTSSLTSLILPWKYYYSPIDCHRECNLSSILCHPFPPTHFSPKIFPALRRLKLHIKTDEPYMPGCWGPHVWSMPSNEDQERIENAVLSMADAVVREREEVGEEVGEGLARGGLEVEFTLHFSVYTSLALAEKTKEGSRSGGGGRVGEVVENVWSKEGWLWRDVEVRAAAAGEDVDGRERVTGYWIKIGQEGAPFID